MPGKNITYYLGAGASANALPVVGEKFNQRFGMFCEITLHVSRHLQLKTVEKFITKIGSEFGYYYSPDTYARKLFFNDKQEYEAFKKLLSSYFIFEQFGELDFNHFNMGLNSALVHNASECFKKNRVKQDPRYDVIFAALLNVRTKKLPKNLNVISWNYDVQFEKSYAAFSLEPLTRSFEHLCVYPCPDKVLVKTKHSSARMVKLNGTAGMINNVENQSILFPDSLQELDINSFFSQAINHIRVALESSYLIEESMLHFAWEGEKEIMNARGRAKKLIAQTDILVVIGYSFPLYNRTTDRAILSSLRPLTRIIVQDGSFDQVSSQMRMALPEKHQSKIEPYLNTGQFYVPAELL